MSALTLLTHQALASLPPELQSLTRAHIARGIDDIDEIVQNVALEFLSAGAGDTLTTIFNRARSTSRRDTQDPAF